MKLIAYRHKEDTVPCYSFEWQDASWMQMNLNLHNIFIAIQGPRQDEVITLMKLSLLQLLETESITEVGRDYGGTAHPPDERIASVASEAPRDWETIRE